MEERIIENEREIKIKRKRGGDDVVDALAEDTEEQEEEELTLELPEDGYDEELVGLTPSQLKEEIARREKARKEAEAECEKLTLAGEERLAEGNYREAEACFSQALLYDRESVRAGKGLWISRTQNFAELEVFYSKGNAEEFAGSPEEVRGFVLEQTGTRLKAQRDEYRAEAEPLKVTVEAKQAERRGPFLSNKKYYRVRFEAAVIAAVACMLGAIVSASFIYSTKGMLPLGFTIAFGALAVVCAAVGVVLARKLLVAHRLCRANEELSSTDEGARLEYLNERLRQLGVILGE